QARAARQRLDLIMKGYIPWATCGVYERTGERCVLISERLKHRSEGCNADVRSNHHRGPRAFEEEMAARSGDLYGSPTCESKEGAFELAVCVLHGKVEVGARRAAGDGHGASEII